MAIGRREKQRHQQKRSLDLQTVIDTHWHFDHTDNNANLHAAGATVLAHENTKTHMAEPHDSELLNGPSATYLSGC
jgi:glyoxylase-like metal-dependent hydrolase (beta-lactamase superfamily II)